jgi:hypothetical protein
VSETWIHKPSAKDRLSTLRFVVLGAGFTVAVVVTVGVEDAGRAALGLIRRALP